MIVLTGGHCASLSAATSCTFKCLLWDFPLDLINLCKTWWKKTKIWDTVNELKENKIKPRSLLIVCLALSMNREKYKVTNHIYLLCDDIIHLHRLSLVMDLICLSYFCSMWGLGGILSSYPRFYPEISKGVLQKWRNWSVPGHLCPNSVVIFWFTISMSEKYQSHLYILGPLSIVIIEASRFNFTLIRRFLNRKLSKTFVLVYGHI